MNISLNWLTDYVDCTMPVDELGELFTRIGLNCEGIEDNDTDIVIDLEVTSNRSDCLGHIGVGRELAVATGAELRLPEIPELPTSGKAADFTSVEVQNTELCPRYTARIIRGVKVGPSPAWLIEKLEAVGLRSVNNIVDITNFVLMEYSQPLHSFDYDKLDEGRIVVRTARDGEELVSIDETICKLDSSMLVIADANEPVAIAGIMGGKNTEVSNDTVNILLEAAQFDPLNIRHTSRTLGLMSDSNFRFERGIDPVKLEESSRRACQLILDLAGGELAEGIVDVWPEPWQAPTVTLRPERTCSLLGMDVTPERQTEILDMLGLSAKYDGSVITCTIPPHRADLTREVDLIEEVARIENYDNIPVQHTVTHEVITEDKNRRVRAKIAGVMSASGFDEAITFTFIDAEEGKLFGFDECVCVDAMVRKTNNALRPTVLCSLLRACKTNQDAGNSVINLYELAAVFPPAKGKALPDEFVEIGMVTTRTLRDLRGAIEAIFDILTPQAKLEVVPAPLTGFTDGISAKITLNGDEIGTIGQVSNKLLDYYGLTQGVAAGRLRLEPIVDEANLIPTYTNVAKFPPIMRDLSLIVDETTTWNRMMEAISKVDQPLLAGIDYVTTYRGKQIPSGKKSVTLSLTYRSDADTLRHEQVDQEISQVVDVCKQEFAAELRA